MLNIHLKIIISLVTGFSVISGIEVLYWIWFKVLFNRKNTISPVEEDKDKKQMKAEIQSSKEEIKALRNDLLEMKMRLKSHAEDPKVSVYFDAIFNDVEAQHSCGVKAP